MCSSVPLQRKSQSNSNSNSNSTPGTAIDPLSFFCPGVASLHRRIVAAPRSCNLHESKLVGLASLTWLALKVALALGSAAAWGVLHGKPPASFCTLPHDRPRHYTASGPYCALQHEVCPLTP